MAPTPGQWSAGPLAPALQASQAGVVSVFMSAQGGFLQAAGGCRATGPTHQARGGSGPRKPACMTLGLAGCVCGAEHRTKLVCGGPGGRRLGRCANCNSLIWRPQTGFSHTQMQPVWAVVCGAVDKRPVQRSEICPVAAESCRSGQGWRNGTRATILPWQSCALSPCRTQVTLLASSAPTKRPSLLTPKLEQAEIKPTGTMLRTFAKKSARLAPGCQGLTAHPGMSLLGVRGGLFNQIPRTMATQLDPSLTDAVPTPGGSIKDVQEVGRLRSFAELPSNWLEHKETPD